MSEVKAGDVAWFRGRLVEWADGSRRASQVLSDTAIPDSPALPAVARWLAEHPDAARILGGVLDAAQFADTLRYTERDGVARFEPVSAKDFHAATNRLSDGGFKRLRKLVAALATDAADGGAG